MLKLVVTEEERQVNSGIVPVRWCVQDTEIERLKNAGVPLEETYLLIIVATTYEISGGEMHYNVESHYIPRFDQGMEYVQFRKPGKHTICAAIVWDKKYDERSPWRFKRELKPHIAVLGGRFDPRYVHDNVAVLESTEIDVVVPEGVFAKKPPAWEQRWVNFWYESRAKDQCQYRKRRLYAYTFKPVFALAAAVWLILIRVVAAAFFLMRGNPGVNFSPLVHPWQYETGNIWSGTRRSVFHPNDARVFFMLPLSPLYTFVLLILAGAQMLDHAHTVTWWVIAQALGFQLVTIFAGFCFWVVGMIIFRGKLQFAANWTWRRFLAHSPSQMLERKVAREQKVRQEMLERYNTAAGYLVCTRGDMTPALGALPKSRRTFHLIFQDFKMKVCRPFAQ